MCAVITLVAADCLVCAVRQCEWVERAEAEQRGARCSFLTEAERELRGQTWTWRQDQAGRRGEVTL